MTDTRFEAQVRRHGDVTVVSMSGDVDAAAEAGLSAAYEQAATGRPRRVLLNFDDVRYINSTGLALIVATLAKARVAGIEVAACGLSDHYRHVFEITRLADFITMFSDEGSAVAAPAGA